MASVATEQLLQFDLITEANKEKHYILTVVFYNGSYQCADVCSYRAMCNI